MPQSPDPLDQLDDAVAAAAFRRLVRHLRHRHDAQNIELMGLAGFCRNCLADWIRDAGYATPNQHYVHADIGVTGTWGYPIKFKNVGDDQLARFAAYSDMPPTLRPDLILIDGRFRVACALKCIKALGDDTGWVIVVDDYVDRTGYHVIEEFAQLQKMVGRMAVFGAKSDLDLVALDEKISSHLYDCR